MPVSYSRTYVRRVWPTDAQVQARVLEVAQTYAKYAVQQVKAKVWNYGRFVYRNVRPKPTSSKSEKAWLGWAEKMHNGEISIVLRNPATDKRGVNYPKYVHLTGRPRSDKLMEEVRDFMDAEIAPKLGKAVASALVEQRASMPVKTTTERFGG